MNKAQEVYLVLQESQGPKDHQDKLAVMGSQVKKVNQVLWECQEPEALQDLLEMQESQVSQDPKDLQDFQGTPADQGLKENLELQAKSSVLRVHRLLLSQAPLAHLAHLAPLDTPVFQVLLGQLVSLDSKVHGVRKDPQVKLW